MEHTAFEAWARLLLLGHAVLAIALAGASTHLALVSIKQVRRGAMQARLVRLHGQTTSLLYVAAFVFGLVVYPTYRYHVRGLYFDRYVPWASNLFDIKENLAALALPLAIALFVLARRFDSRSGAGASSTVAVLAVGIWIAVAFSTLSGLLVTCVKGV